MGKCEICQWKGLDRRKKIHSLIPTKIEQMCIIKNAQMFNQTKKKNQQKKNKALRAI